MTKPCLRCNGPAHRHPTGSPVYCLHYIEPAPLWMRVVSWLASRSMGGRP